MQFLPKDYIAARTFQGGGVAMTDRVAAERRKMGIREVGHNTDYFHAYVGLGSSGATAEKSIQEKFKTVVRKYKDVSQLKSQELKDFKDWREMSDDEWDRMLEAVDTSIDAYLEHLKQMKEMKEESALQVAKEILYDLENPLTPISERGENVELLIQQEKEFYKKFIEKLEDISSIGS